MWFALVHLMLYTYNTGACNTTLLQAAVPALHAATGDVEVEQSWGVIHSDNVGFHVAV